MNDSDKIRKIKEVFEEFHRGEDIDGREIDTIDAMMSIESIVYEE